MIGRDFLSEHLISTLGQDNVCFHRVLVAQWFRPMPYGEIGGNYFRLCKLNFKKKSFLMLSFQKYKILASFLHNHSKRMNLRTTGSLHKFHLTLEPGSVESQCFVISSKSSLPFLPLLLSRSLKFGEPLWVEEDNFTQVSSTGCRLWIWGNQPHSSCYGQESSWFFLPHKFPSLLIVPSDLVSRGGNTSEGPEWSIGGECSRESWPGRVLHGSYPHTQHLTYFPFRGNMSR